MRTPAHFTSPGGQNKGLSSIGTMLRGPENARSPRQRSPSATPIITTSTRTALGMNPVLHGVKLSTSTLSYGTTNLTIATGNWVT